MIDESTFSQRPAAPLRVALLGTRGIPARYGGFETFAEHLAVRLVARGHEVAVYGRRPFFRSARTSIFQGVECRVTPTIMHKYLETPLHSLTSFIDLLFRRVDVVLLCNAANAPFAWVARLKGVPVAINVDGIERRRSKWNALGRWWYRVGESCSVWFGSPVIADAEVIAGYYRRTHGIEPAVIAYGAEAVRIEAGEVLRKFGLTPGGYLLYVARLEPENNALGVVEGYRASGLSIPLVVVGDAPYAQEYIQRLHRAAEGLSVVFTGYQFGDAYRELQSNCLIYIQATEVGGTHPALIEAMAFENAIIANETPENLEVLGAAGEYYRRNDFVNLGEQLRLLCNSNDRIAQLRRAAKARASERYTWDHITEQYEELLTRIARRDKRSTLI